jgi:predicted O-linked N-acetylglucosamine transferase (SPINDLY family)
MADVTLDQAMAEGARLEKAGQLQHAEAVYRAIVGQIPRCDAAMARLAFLAHQSGRADQAVDWFLRAAEANPSAVEYRANLGIVLVGLGKLQEAADAFSRALVLRPDHADLYVNLGNVQAAMKQKDRAIDSYRTALGLNPNNSRAWYNLGNLFWEMGRFREAVDTQSRAIALEPNFGEAHLSLGSALRNEGRMDEAMRSFTRAIELRPDLGEAYTGLAAVYQATGRVRDAIQCYRRAARMTGRPGVTDILLVALHLDPANDAKSLYEEHAAWNRTFARPLAAEIQPHQNDPSPDRPLRVGFVSAYLSSRPVGRFLRPLFDRHDRSAFQFVCYSDVRGPDAATHALRATTHLWRDTSDLEDADLARLVRDDRIDILFDLGMHTRWNRMLAFARKPAPVQVTYLAYCGTTGLETIDYRISDPHLDPTDADQPFYSERTVRLTSYWCYPAPEAAPPVNELPAARNGFVTFGCLNDFGKVSDLSLSMWGRTMSRIPGSRFILHCLEGAHRNRVLEALAAHGVTADRVEFLGMQPMSQYFATYHRIDIALDPTPWCGGTTTCDALYMGVPVVTLSGKTAVSRGGASILGQLGLTQWVAQSPDDYVRLAHHLANNLPQLVQHRATVRDRMHTSRLMDGAAFTREFEAELRKMWRTWCESRQK